MRPRPPALVLVALLAVAPAVPRAAAADSAEELLRAVAACQRVLDGELETGAGHLTARCPALVAELRSSSWAALLPAGWSDAGPELTGTSLTELATLIVRERAARAAAASALVPPGRHAPLSLEGVAAVLRDLAPPPEGVSSPWTRLEQWLRAHLGALEAQRAERAWTLHSIGRPDARLVHRLRDGALGLLVALALLAVGNELRLAARQRRRGGRGAPLRTARAAPQQADLELQGRAPRERAAQLLLRLIDSLIRTRRLPPAGTLTVDELAACARFELAADSERFNRLARVAERLRFAARPPGTEELELALGSGLELLLRLEGGRPV